MADPLIPDLHPEWKAIRRLADAIAECVDNAVEDLLEGVPSALRDEDRVEELTERVYNFATKGEHP